EPMEVMLTAEITVMIRVCTKRVEMQGAVDPAAYTAAPWWEKRIYDGGERVLKVGDAVQLSQYPNRFQNSLIVAIISTVLAVSMGTITAYGFSRFRIAGAAGCLFFIPFRSTLLPPDAALSRLLT